MRCLKNSKILAFIFISLTVISCEKEPSSLKLPGISSSKIFTLSSNAVTIKSTFFVSKEDSITNIGVSWSTQSNPTKSNNFTNSYLSDSVMFTRIEGLTPNKKYYARVYATNAEKEIYGPEIEFTTNSTVLDVDGNLYNAVTIGSQVWMVENLSTTKYNDGTPIPVIDKSINWATFNSPGYGWYNYERNKPYGALYNWEVVNSGKLCPKGWHVPSDIEWSTLANYFDGESSAGRHLKSTSTDWVFSNNKITNYAGFCAVPAGGSAAVMGSFTGKGLFTVWWSSTIDYDKDNSNEGMIITRILWHTLYKDGFMSRGGNFNFLSVRCIKD